MGQIVNIHIEKLPEGVYLATSDDIPGLVVRAALLPRRWRLPEMWPKNC